MTGVINPLNFEEPFALYLLEFYKKMNVTPKNTHRQVHADKYEKAKHLLKSKTVYDDLNFMDVQVQEIPSHLNKKELIDYYAEGIMDKAKERGFKVKTRCPKLKDFIKRNPAYLEVCI